MAGKEKLNLNDQTNDTEVINSDISIPFFTDSSDSIFSNFQFNTLPTNQPIDIKENILRIQKIINTIDRRRKWFILKSFLIHNFYTIHFQLFLSFSNGIKEYKRLSLKKRFKYWKNEVKWIHLCRLIVHDSTMKSLQFLASHRKKILSSQSQWNEIVSNLVLAHKIQCFQDLKFDHQNRILQQDYFEIWHLKWNRRHRRRETFQKLVQNYSHYLLQNSLISNHDFIQHFHQWKHFYSKLFIGFKITCIKTSYLHFWRQFKWQQMIYQRLRRTLRYRCRKEREKLYNRFKWINLISNYIKFQRKNALIQGKQVYNTTLQFRHVVKTISHEYKKASFTIALNQYQLLLFQKKLVVDSFKKWRIKQLQNFASRSLITYMIDECINEYQYSLYNKSALLIQKYVRIFFEKLKIQKQIKEKYFLKWLILFQKFPLYFIKFPSFIVKIPSPIAFNLSSLSIF